MLWKEKNLKKLKKVSKKIRNVSGYINDFRYLSDYHKFWFPKILMDCIHTVNLYAILFMKVWTIHENNSDTEGYIQFILSTASQNIGASAKI